MKIDNYLALYVVCRELEDYNNFLISIPFRENIQIIPITSEEDVMRYAASAHSTKGNYGVFFMDEWYYGLSVEESKFIETFFKNPMFKNLNEMNGFYGNYPLCSSEAYLSIDVGCLDDNDHDAPFALFDAMKRKIADCSGCKYLDMQTEQSVRVDTYSKVFSARANCQLLHGACPNIVDYPNPKEWTKGGESYTVLNAEPHKKEKESEKKQSVPDPENYGTW